MPQRAGWLLFGAVQISDVKHIKTAVSLIDIVWVGFFVVEVTAAGNLISVNGRLLSRRSTGKLLDTVSWGDGG